MSAGTYVSFNIDLRAEPRDCGRKDFRLAADMANRMVMVLVGVERTTGGRVWRIICCRRRGLCLSMASAAFLVLGAITVAQRGTWIDEKGRMTRQGACRDTRGSEKSDEFTPGARSTQIFPHRRRAHKCQKWR